MTQEIIYSTGQGIAGDKQIGGNHYIKLKIQPTDYIVENGLDYLQGNIIKYVTRFRDKNGLEDLEKAKHYLEMLTAREQKLAS